ncbi:MAG: DUF362 domain-containing protein [Candidatus Thorarchaeota archaeon]
MDSMSEVAIGLRRTPIDSLRAAISKLNLTISSPTSGANIIIKPSIYDPNLPGNTDVRMVQAVIQTFSSLGTMSIVESDNPLRTAKVAFSKMGYDELVNENVRLVNLSDDKMVPVTFAGQFFKDRKIPHILHHNSYLVNLATLKAEPEICLVGAGIKNLFGLLPEPDKSIYHSDINEVLMDLLMIFRPQLTVIDLTNIVIGKREEKRTKYVGGVVVGTDPVAVDSFCSNLLGIDPLEVDHLRMAHRLGLGEILSDRINVRGTQHQISELYRLFGK